jgi:hypothetical protein
VGLTKGDYRSVFAADKQTENFLQLAVLNRQGFKAIASSAEALRCLEN